MAYSSACPSANPYQVNKLSLNCLCADQWTWMFALFNSDQMERDGASRTLRHQCAANKHAAAQRHVTSWQQIRRPPHTSLVGGGDGYPRQRKLPIDICRTKWRRRTQGVAIVVSKHPIPNPKLVTGHRLAGKLGRWAGRSPLAYEEPVA